MVVGIWGVVSKKGMDIEDVEAEVGGLKPPIRAVLRTKLRQTIKERSDTNGYLLRPRVSLEGRRSYLDVSAHCVLLWLRCLQSKARRLT